MVKGLAEFNRRMKRIPENVRRAAQEVIDANAADLVATQKSFVPVDEGDLRESIRTFPLGGLRVGAVVKAGGATTTRPVRNGISVTFDYALAQEFGTENMQANPFFFPAYRLNKRKHKARVTRAIKKAIRS